MSDLARSPQHVGQLIRKRRRTLKLTQAELAKKVGSYQKTISKLESGEPGIKLQTLFDVLAALDLEIVMQRRSGSRVRIEDLF